MNGGKSDPPFQVDVEANRSATKWTLSEKLGRTLWALIQPAFFLSPRVFWAWRRWLLVLFGARVGKGVHVYPSTRITIPWNLKLGDYCAIGDRVILYALGPIELGPRSTLSQGAHLCAGTHDWSNPQRPLEKPPIVICQDAWVCADAFVGPGVIIGESAILGARAVAMADIPPNAIAIGNPAKVVSKRNPVSRN